MFLLKNCVNKNLYKEIIRLFTSQLRTRPFKRRHFLRDAVYFVLINIMALALYYPEKITSEPETKTTESASFFLTLKHLSDTHFSSPPANF